MSGSASVKRRSRSARGTAPGTGGVVAFIAPLFLEQARFRGPRDHSPDTSLKMASPDTLGPPLRSVHFLIEQHVATLGAGQVDRHPHLGGARRNRGNQPVADAVEEASGSRPL